MILLIVLAIIIFLFASLWKVFEKAGEPGWAAIVPFYNYFVLAKIAEKPMWWGALCLIPYANIVFLIWIWNRVVKRFGKSEGYTVGVILLGIVFIPMLAFGDATYTPQGDGPSEGNASTPPPAPTPTPEVSAPEENSDDENTSAE